MLTVATVNVNGIRAAWRRGMPGWLASRAPDVLLLQEVRAPEPILAGLLDGWHLAQSVSELAGRAGVAVASRLPIRAVRVGVAAGASELPVDSGRWLEVDLDDAGRPLTVVSLYAHSGEMDSPKMDAKYRHLDKVTARMGELAASGVDVVVGGDINITHRDQDLANWRGNRKSAGTQPDERAHLDRWCTEFGFTDVHRQLAGDVSGPYTWWSWRGRAFDNDTGWRIDYQFATPGLAERAVSAQVDRAATNPERWSDHAALVITYDR